MWWQGFILGKIFHSWPHLVGWLDGLEAFLLLTDHFHRRPGATITLPPTHHPNVKMFIIKPLVFDLCSLLSFVALQGGRVWLKDPDAVWKPAEVRFDLFSKIKSI